MQAGIWNEQSFNESKLGFVEAIVFALDKLEEFTQGEIKTIAANKLPQVYLSYQVAKAYSLQDSYTAPECKLLSFMNRQADKYIVNPLLQQIGINQGDPGYVTGKIIIDTALAAAITEGVQAKIASPYTVVPAKPTAITYRKPIIWSTTNDLTNIKNAFYHYKSMVSILVIFITLNNM